MDLVDIDQVLDNLELREAADENKVILQRQQLSNGVESVTQSTARGFTNKSFVGVSQVFNSLDDYRKNVQSLEAATPQKYDEECRPIVAGSGVKKIDETETNNVIKQRTSAEHSVATTNAGTAHKELNERSIDGDEDDDDDDDEAHNDIYKFSEATNIRLTGNEDEGDDITTTTSDSLTTSSSSTFSSGPSPGLASTTDEHSTPLSHIDDERRVLLESEYQPQQQQNDVATVDVMLPERNALPDGENRATLEDLAVGLSSISITTANSQSALPCEVSVSSALGNILQELSDTTSTSLLSQQQREQREAKAQPDESRTPATESPSYPEAIQVQTKGEEAVCVQPEAPANKHAAQNEAQCHQSVKPPKQQQPITFSSTMDEISDTELDSMLQEMDIDDVGAEEHAMHNDNRMQTNQTAENIQEHQQQEQTHQQPQEDIIASALKVHSNADEISLEEDAASNVVDYLNADSFSQASTVEISEIRAQSLQAIQPDELGQCSNSIASSYTGSESSLDGNVIAAPVAITLEDAEEVDEQSRMRPQRPTTLDLPTLQPSLVANAGQTPPETQSSAVKESTTEPEVDADADGVGGIVEQTHDDAVLNEIAEATGYSDPHADLGKIPPIWVPDNMAAGCMQCHTKFTMIKRRHHCRACGKVLCSACCSQKFKLDFCADPESRVCVQCYLILTQRQHSDAAPSAVVTDDVATLTASTRSPNPNNPMEYCSTIPPHRQVSTVATQPPSVIVPVGVLKKDTSSSNSSNSSGKKARKRKSVMFSDGIAPGSDLASMEHQWSEAKHARRGHQQGEKSRANKPSTPAKTEPKTDATLALVAQLFRGSIPPSAAAAAVSAAETVSEPNRLKETHTTPASTQKTSTEKTSTNRPKRLPPSGCDEVGCFIPKGDGCLPPICLGKQDSGGNIEYKEVVNNYELIERLRVETLKFAVEKNLFVNVRIVNLKCCMNRVVINFTTYGMHHVGNDEIIILLEFEAPGRKELMTEPPMPKDIFVHLHEIYREAELGNPIAELAYTSPQQSNFLGTRDYGGFIFIRSTFQCLQDVIVPENPFLIGILIHRYEVPWAKVFPLRLMLRLGAQYRYYPCPHISMRNRESVYAEIAQTIINFLADFRNYSYTLPCIKGMYIHMEDRQTTVMIPRNRQEDVIKAINNASDHILAFGGNFSKTADGHLVCMQNVNDNRTEMYSYSTQAINIQGQPRKVTGASFFVLNEALKSTSGLSGKCSIVEDGLMVQIMPAKMEAVRNALRNQKDIDIICGPLDAEEQQTEIVSIKWVENDRDFNIGVKSPIDEKSFEGISSMRVHASFNYANTNYSIRLTDIYILKFDEWYTAAQSTLAATSLDITRIAEQIARSASLALVPFLDLLVASGSIKIGLRATLHQDNVCYEAGTRGAKLPPLYMNALDNHLIPTLHSESSGIEETIILELVFYILNV